jgi:methyl-accepting chemotaxis protein
MKMNLSVKFVVAFLVVGILPLSITGYLSLEKSSESIRDLAFDQLESIREIKRNQVLQYFSTLEKQAITVTEDKMVIDAMADFKRAFHSFIDENGIEKQNIGQLRDQLASYYEEEFGKEFINRNNGNRPDVRSIVNRLDEESVALQYHYIKANSHPLGSKHLLDKASDNSSYSRLHEKFHPIMRSYVEKFGYYDFFLVDADTGDIVYTDFKELDFSTSLLDGPYADSNLAEAFKKANAALSKDVVVIADLKQYFPSYMAPAGFLASPIYDGDKKIGIGIFQFPIDTLNAIMQERSGMGQTGETYLVGMDYLMRSDSYLDPQHHSLIASFTMPEKGKVETEASREALRGRKGNKIITDYNGNAVLSAYTPLKIGDTTWALIAEIDEAEAFAPVNQLKIMVGIVALAVVVAIIAVALLMSRAIAKPIRKGVDFAKAMSEGDLMQTLVVDRVDELGVLAGSLNTMANSMRKMFRDIRRGIETLSAASTELSAISNHMSVGAEQTKGKSNTVAAAVEEMSANMSNVAASSEQTSANVQMVAAAVEQMSATIREIAGNTERGRSITEMAVKNAKAASERVEELGRAASEVGRVTESINEISEQTNLLALNATIEAARAGEAGKGFSIVANEIKELAKMTAVATEDIRGKIEGMQTTTDKTVLEISQIEQVIGQINDIVSTISAAVEEQSVSTSEIAENVNQAAQGIQDVNENVTQSSTVASSIAREVIEVNESAREMADSSSHVDSKAVDLSRLAEQLHEMVRQFRVKPA